MRTIRKEIQTYIIIGIITLLVVSILLVRIKTTQSSTKINLIEFVPSSATAIMRINKPNDMKKFILSDKNMNEIFSTQVPTVFLKLINNVCGDQICICSFHPQGIVFYTQVNNITQINNIKDKILQPYFGSFPPQTQKIANTNIKFYAGKNNQFLGYYQKNGIFFASYSRKLLEETLSPSSNNQNPELTKVITDADAKAPFNLFINSDLLKLQINLTDSTTWKLKSRWFAADFFMNKNRLCYFGSLPYFKDIDSLYAPLADTITKRIKSTFPKFNFSSEINIESNNMLYTGRLEDSSDY